MSSYNKQKKIMIIFGTRPEAIKMAPVVMEFLKRQKNGAHLHVSVCVTAQHRDMLDQVLELFEIHPQYDLNIMSPNQNLAQLTSKIINGVSEVLLHAKPDLVFVHGDTTTSFAAALAAFYQQIRVAHVEAGLRTDNKYSPFPEELNRHLTGVIADLHFSPTQRAKENLEKENVTPESIFVTGNTVIDSLLYTAKKIKNQPERLQRYKDQLKSIEKISSERSIILITGHRRENFGTGFENICAAIAELAVQRPHIEFIYPVHLNPNVQEPVYSIIGKHPNIKLLPPMDYEPFVFLMKRAQIILTDSGGIQEEAPSLGKPVLVMREVTERPEAVSAGTVELVGTDRLKIVQSVNRLLDDHEYYTRMSYAHNPYGDGKAAIRIADHTESYFGIN
jgi:UDP-N-acetylglucosamine 2-epimerase (non-hydrolysing)